MRDLRVRGRVSVPQLVAYVRTPDAREAVNRAADKRFSVRFCVYEDEIPRAAMQSDVAMIVWDMAPGSVRQLPAVAKAIQGRSAPLPFLVRIDMTRLAARQVAELCEHMPHVRPSVHGYNDLAADIIDLCAASDEPRAHFAIAGRLVPISTPRVADIVSAASLAGDRRVSCRAFEDICGVPMRSIEWRLHRDHGWEVRHLLGWVLSLHSLWRTGVLGWNTRRAAEAAGFSSQASWATYLARHAGARPAELLRNVGFSKLLDRCASEFTCKRSPGQPDV